VVVIARIRLLVAALGLAATACSEPSIAFDQLDRELQRARCERLVRCGLFADDASCLAYFWVLSDPSVAGAIAARKVDYDGALARQCVDATAAQSCDLTAPEARAAPAACSRMLAGTLAGGAACAIDAECASGTCEPATCPEIGCCVGACRPVQPPGAAGTACAKSSECAPALVCASDRTCRELASSGQDCASDRECAAGLGCINPLSTMPGTCRALPHRGEDCPYLRCADEGLRCDEATRRCVALGLPGAACSGPGECSPYLECDPDAQRCREFPQLGMPCRAGCGGEAFCLRDGAPTGTCAAPQPDGSPCTAYNECASFYCEAGPIFDSCKDAPVCF